MNESFPLQPGQLWRVKSSNGLDEALFVLILLTGYDGNYPVAHIAILDKYRQEVVSHMPFVQDSLVKSLGELVLSEYDLGR